MILQPELKMLGSPPVRMAGLLALLGHLFASWKRAAILSGQGPE